MSLIAKILIGFGIFLFLVLWLLIAYMAEQPVVTVDYFTRYNDLTRPEGYNEADNAAILLNNLPEPKTKDKDGNTAGTPGMIDPNMFSGVIDPNMFSGVIDPNILPHVMAGMGMFSETPDFTWNRKYTDYPDKFSPEEISEFKEWMDACQDRLQAIVEASKKPYYYEPVDTTLYRNRTEFLEDQLYIDFGNLVSIDEIGALLSWAVVYHLEKGDNKKIDEYTQAMSNLYKLLKKCSYGYEQYGLNELLMGLDFTDSYLMNPKQEPPKILPVYQQLLSQTDFTTDYDVAVHRLCFLDATQKLFTKGDQGRLSAAALIRREVIYFTSFGDIPTIFSCIYKSMRCENRKKTIERMESIFAKLEEWKSQNLFQLHQGGINMEQELYTLAGKNFIVKQEVDSILYTLRSPRQIACKSQAAKTISALFRFHEDNGHYPESLEALLAGGYLEQLPPDTYSDGPLKYRIQKDDFILYSIGADFEDDGGRHSLCSNCGNHLTDWGDGPVIEEPGKPSDPQKDAKGDHVFWPIPQYTKP